MEYLLFTRGLSIDYSYYCISSYKKINDLFYSYVKKDDRTLPNRWQLLSDSNGVKLIARFYRDGRTDNVSRSIATWEAFLGVYTIDDNLLKNLELMSIEISKKIKYSEPSNQVMLIDSPIEGHKIRH